jgi:hypothetical protein
MSRWAFQRLALYARLWYFRLAFGTDLRADGQTEPPGYSGWRRDEMVVLEAD